MLTTQTKDHQDPVAPFDVFSTFDENIRCLTRRDGTRLFFRPEDVQRVATEPVTLQDDDGPPRKALHVEILFKDGSYAYASVDMREVLRILFI